MTAFWTVMDAIGTYAWLAVGIIIATVLTITAASSRSLVGHWLGYRAGAPRDRISDVLTKHEQRMYDELLIHGGDTGHCPHCIIGRDGNYLPVVIPCREHRPAGKHHATAPEYGPEPVPAKPDFDEWVDEWNRRYAE